MTERAEHTAGPWKQQCFLVTGADGSWVCHTGMGNLPPSRSHESEANARLIAAAPDLLAALIRAREVVNAIVLSTRSVSFDADLRAIDAALSRATGEA